MKILFSLVFSFLFIAIISSSSYASTFLNGQAEEYRLDTLLKSGDNEADLKNRDFKYGSIRYLESAHKIFFSFLGENNEILADEEFENFQINCNNEVCTYTATLDNKSLTITVWDEEKIQVHFTDQNINRNITLSGYYNPRSGFIDCDL